MGTITLTSKRDQDAEALVSTVEIADVDIDRIAVAHAALLFSGVTPTGTLVFKALADKLVQSIIAETRLWEQGRDAQIAINNVPPIVVTPVGEEEPPLPPLVDVSLVDNIGQPFGSIYATGSTGDTGSTGATGDTGATGGII